VPEAIDSSQRTPEIRPETSGDATHDLRELRAASKALGVHAAKLFSRGARSIVRAFRHLFAATAANLPVCWRAVREWATRRRLHRREPTARTAAERASLPTLRFRLPRWTVALTAAVAATLAVILYLIASLPINGGLQADSQGAMTFEAASGETFAARGVLRGAQVGAADLPQHFLQAVIAIEDRRFHDHAGIDLRGIARAALRNMGYGGVREGGSTISQQLARLLYLSSERTIRRKLQEALLALWLESRLSKEEILLKYVNTAFFGAGAYGIDAAARRYFGKAPKDLTLAESAMLAGLIRSPSQLAPTRNFGGAKERAEVVLQAMVETGVITGEAADAARSQNVALRAPTETPPGSNYFVDMVSADFRRLLGPLAGDVKLQTTLDLDLQNLAQGVIERRLDAEGGKRKISQAALVAIRRDGAIVAMVGGRDYEASQFNRAVQARRQPGSLFKVFVYDAALQRGLNPQSTVVDRPVRIADWEPENYSGGYRGPMSARNAFANSVNTVAVQLADEIGIQAVIESARRLGVQSPLPAVPSLALGSAEVTLLEMTKAMAAIAAGVQSLEPYAIRAIAGPNEQALYTKGRTGGEVSGPAGATRAMMLELLQAVVESGTGRAARVGNVPVAGKTGTTQEYRDAWFVGFTPELTVGVWVGNDDNSPMSNVTGGDVPARIWSEFIDQALKRKARTATTARSPAGERTAAEAVRGRAEVIDTATLDVGGRPIALFGIEANRDARAIRALAHYLRRREVVCAPVANASGHRCLASGQDLTEAILAAGASRAAANAPPDLLAVEEMARAQRVGIWRR
jgi:1A family penicillin-binding protein